jgi:hypothetical protein
MLEAFRTAPEGAIDIQRLRYALRLRSGQALKADPDTNLFDVRMFLLGFRTI